MSSASSKPWRSELPSDRLFEETILILLGILQKKKRLVFTDWKCRLVVILKTQEAKMQWSVTCVRKVATQWLRLLQLKQMDRLCDETVATRNRSLLQSEFTSVRPENSCHPQICHRLTSSHSYFKIRYKCGKLNSVVLWLKTRESMKRNNTSIKKNYDIWCVGGVSILVNLHSLDRLWTLCNRDGSRGIIVVFWLYTRFRWASSLQNYGRCKVTWYWGFPFIFSCGFSAMFALFVYDKIILVFLLAVDIHMLQLRLKKNSGPQLI